jgi:two-component system sensor histidine kinase and response regulator WspE
MAKSVGGSVRATTSSGRGTRFQIQLPLTLSVIRALLVEVGGEPYAFPLVRLRSAIRIPREQIETLEGKEHVPFGHQQIGLVSGSQLFGKEASPPQETLPVVVIGDRTNCFGVAVDSFLGERQLVVQPLDPRLGKIKDISAGALMPDGSPVLIVDVDDLLRSIATLISGGGINKLRMQGAIRGSRRRKRVLVVDDSLTVRELERKLLSDAGYEVEAAVDGMDGWNAVRTQAYDLVVTDIDMPRLDGIELVRLIKNEARVKSIPVMIVSYKDRPEDRHRGLEAGADYYLTKGSFHDETLLHAVADLIGKADEEELPK